MKTNSVLAHAGGQAMGHRYQPIERPSLACSYVYVPLADSHTTATYSPSHTSLVATICAGDLMNLSQVIAQTR